MYAITVAYHYSIIFIPTQLALLRAMEAQHTAADFLGGVPSSQSKTMAHVPSRCFGKIQSILESYHYLTIFVCMVS